jgi:hypothetical protein
MTWQARDVAAMSETDRSDLYTGPSEVLGPDRAEVLMAQLPRFDPAEVATRSDLAAQRSDFAALRSDFTGLRSDFAELRSDTRLDISELRGELSGGLAAVNQRLDRLFLTLLVAMFGVVAAMVGVILSVA